MTAETLDNSVLLQSLDETVSKLQAMMPLIHDDELNTVPFKDSWTAGMLYRHVTKVTGGMAGAMQMPSKPADRDADERVPELKKTFLDFSIKMKAPDMAVPEQGSYQKQELLDKLHASVEKLKEAAGTQNLNELVSGLPLGDITKQEILHFVLYHTQRHLHQLQKIVDALHKKEVPAGEQH